MEATLTKNPFFALYYAVKKLVVESPEAVYYGEKEEPVTPGTMLGCWYEKGNCSNGKSGCLIGQALMMLGFGTHQLRLLSVDGGVATAKTPLTRLLTGEDRERTPEEDRVLNFLAIVQQQQDRGYSWGESWKFADGKFPYLRPVRT